jgi:hypothetical protein
MNWEKGIQRITVVISMATSLLAVSLCFPKILDKWHEYKRQTELSMVKRTAPKWEANVDSSSNLYKVFHGEYSDLMEAVKMNIDTFAVLVKKTYPVYKDINDTDLTVRVLKKYPYYEKYVQIDAPWVWYQIHDESDEERKRKEEKVKSDLLASKGEFWAELKYSVFLVLGCAAFPWIIFGIGLFIRNGFVENKP